MSNELIETIHPLTGDGSIEKRGFDAPSYSEGEKASVEGGKPMDEEEEDYTPNVVDPFPIVPGELEETHQLTFRAIFVGCCLGAVVGASNIYLGLKTGFTFGPQLFGAIFGYAIIKPLSRALPESGLLGRFLGGPFGPKENCTVQSAATAAGGIGIIFVSAIPAMYRLHLLSFSPKDDTGRLIALTTCTAFFGVFFVIPLRKYYIVHQKLVFPTPTATAFTIRALHNAKTGAIAARKKSLALLFSFIACFCFKVVNGYVPGVLLDWHIGWTLSRIGFTSIIALENYGWILEFTPAFFGAGMLSGLNASWSFLGGAVVAWGIIAPATVHLGEAVGVPVSPDFPELVSYQALQFDNLSDYINNPSPRYWLLWPGVLMMLTYSFADLFCNMLPTFIRLGREGMQNLNIKGLFRPRSADYVDEDSTPIEHRVPLLWWTTGLLASVIMTCALLATQFNFGVGEGILSMLLGFIFSFIAVLSSGTTDINPVSTVAKASQLIFGGIGKVTTTNMPDAQMLNLTGGTIAAGSAGQSSDMTGDLKTGYLLRAKPRVQFIAQLCGATVAIFLNVGLFILFTTASPCIMYVPKDGLCTYSAPSVAAWAAVATAVTSPVLPVPPSSGYTAIALSIFAVITVFIRHYFIPKKYWIWVPNWNAFGLAFVVPQTYYPIAMAIGSTFNYVWLKKWPKGFDMYMFAVAAGLLAGEGLGGVFQALLAVAGVGGSDKGSAIGCPAMEFCG